MLATIETLHLFLLSGLLLFGSRRASVTLKWDPPSRKDIAHYRVYYTDMTRAKAAKAKWIDVGKATQASVSDLVSGHTYYFVVTAFNSAGRESQPSKLVKYVAGSSPMRKPTPTPTSNSHHPKRNPSKASSTD